MNGIEILLNGIVQIFLSVVMLIHIDRKCYPTTKAKIFFAIPLWSMFLGFYYLRTYLDGREVNEYWKEFRMFEIATNVLFVAFFMYKNKKLKRRE